MLRSGGPDGAASGALRCHPAARDTAVGARRRRPPRRVRYARHAPAIVSGLLLAAVPGLVAPQWALAQSSGPPAIGTPDVVGAVAIVAAAVLGCVVAVLVRGRDARPAKLPAHVPTRPPESDGSASDSPAPGASARSPKLCDDPPKGVRPAEVGILLDARPETEHLVATIIDLIVRGCLTVAHEEDGSWTLRRTDTDPPDLQIYERTLLKKLFPTVQGRRRRTTSTLQITLTKGGFTIARQALERRVGELGYFREPPHAARRRMRTIGTAIGLAGLALVLPLTLFAGRGMWAVALIVAGLGVVATAPLMPARTPLGSGVREQTEQLRNFLVAADPELIDWREHPRAFSEYLPWAVVLGVQENWTQLFQQLTDDGRLTPKTPWYLPVKESFWHREGRIEAISELVRELSIAITMADRHEEVAPDDDSPQRW